MSLSLPPGLPGMSLDNRNHNTPALLDDAYFAAATARPKIHGFRDIGILMNSRRTASLNAIRGGPSACIDEDNSGTYDPSESRSKSVVSQPKKIKKAKKENGNDDPSREQTRRRTQVGYSLPVIFTLSSAKATNYLRSISPGPFNDDSNGPERIKESPNAGNGNLFTRRRVKRPTRLGGEATRVDGLTLDQLSDGHPQRRGCKACFAAEDDNCSLIDNAFDYPCISCLDAGIDCELITPPEFKRICERCKKKRIPCSYKIDGGRGFSECENCRNAAVTCCAGPLRATHAKKFQGEMATTSSIESVPPQSRASVQTSITAPTTALTGVAPLSSIFPQTAAALQIAAVSETTASPQTAVSSRVATTPQTSASLQTVVAAPLVPATSLPPPTAATPPPPRMYVACNQCRGEGLRCNLKRHQTGPCSNCKQSNEACKFVLIPPPEKLIRNNVASARGGSTSNKSTKKLSSKNKTKKRKLPAKKSLGGKGTVSKRGSRNTSFHPPAPEHRMTQGIPHILICTSFAHPISFNHVPAPGGSHHCSWCSSPFFGLFGHGEREVEVIPWPNGHGYEEIGLDPAENLANISNIKFNNNIGCRGNVNAKGKEQKFSKDLRGHSQLGEEYSRMCISCTFQRVCIMACDSHQMKSMEDIDPRVYNEREFERAVVALQSGDKEGSRLVTEARWCSVCPALAEHRCIAKQENILVVKDDFDVERQGRNRADCGRGCGLLLCETCNDLLSKLEIAKMFSLAPATRDTNTLDLLVRMVQGDKFHYPIGTRADAEFLTSEGELSRRLEKGFGEDMDMENMEQYSDEEDEHCDDNLMDVGVTASQNEDSIFRGEKRTQEGEASKTGGEIEVIVISDDDN